MKLNKHRLTLIACIVSGLLSSIPASAETKTTQTSISKTPGEQTAAEKKDVKEALKDAVVHVYVVKHAYSTLSPWNSNTRKGSGSGLIIEGGLVLTNAHVAADATFLELQRHGETKRHEAEVVYISHEADLALLRTKEKDLYKDVKPLELGELPEVQQDVEVYGFPIGGTTLSVTRGVVSRIEKQDYAHANENLIAVQVDAAINFGNSGGPVISDDKVVGVAMQSGFFTENIGYMIPTPILRHFLKDIKDGKQDGFGYPGFQVQSMENPAMRRKYGLNEEQTGILVHKVYENTPSEEVVEVGDIITAIDGYSIENNGTVEFRPGEYLNYTHYIDLHQLGEAVKLDVIRDSKPVELTITLDKPGKDYLLVKPNEYDKQPTYYIHGGFVFMPLNQDVMDSMDPVPASLASASMSPPTEELKEVVIMTKVLPADINKDHHHDAGLVIEKINGEQFTDFNEFFEKIQSSDSDFIVLEADDGYQIVIDNKEAQEKQAAILARYGINSDRSKDLTDKPTLKTASNGR
uniref:Peptidase S1 n=1 Tax=uncultured Thiotrichaceae bacterium TaxID=298394 RepID=A0A6S6U898_9GAMM|nr:MAG: Peptidase S1 [uncultured Thiotrichaceae bacterium]